MNLSLSRFNVGSKLRLVSDCRLLFTGLLLVFPGRSLVTADESAPVSLDAGPSFYHEIIPALSRLGCSSGACHGSPNGKNGFRLSLRGYDAKADIQSIVRDELGRRVNVMSPEISLLLSKPMMHIHHGGGKKLRLSDPEYEILRNWLSRGCQVAEPASACTGIRFGPSDQLLLSPENSQQKLTVWAVFADGTQKDVSTLAVYSSSDLLVATVNDHGCVEGVGRGQAGISARFLEHWSTLFVTYAPGEKTPFKPRLQQQNVVDELVGQQLEQLHFEPSILCSDEQFVRRVYLDVIGLLPTVLEVHSFLTDQDAHKREKLINSLIDRPEFGRFWALKWGDLLRINKQQVSSTGVQKYNRWLVKAIDENMPYDKFVKELLLSQGSTFENPPANYYRTANNLNDATETTAQIFLGARLECCKCHNHPFEKWTQDNYYGFAAFFNRMQRKPTRRVDEMVIWNSDEGEVVHPRTNQQMHPWLPGVGIVNDESSGNRRITLVNWLTSKDNELFASVEVNRIWSHVMGRGIVEPVDDFRDSNPPSNPKLLATLAADFREHEFDRKRTLRLILNSQTYQSSSTATDGNRNDDKYFSHYRPRLLTAEQLLDAVGAITEQPEQFRGLPAGTRATQLPSPDLSSEFLEVFGQPKRDTVCQCERVTEVTLSQALQIANGKLLQEKLTSPDSRLQRFLKSEYTDRQIIDELFLAAYARNPSEQEYLAISSHFAKRNDRELALQDLTWALINSNEFLMQH